MKRPRFSKAKILFFSAVLSLALGAGTLRAAAPSGETVPAPAKERLVLSGNEGFVRGNGFLFLSPLTPLTQKGPLKP